MEVSPFASSSHMVARATGSVPVTSTTSTSPAVSATEYTSSSPGHSCSPSSVSGAPTVTSSGSAVAGVSAPCWPSYWSSSQSPPGSSQRPLARLHTSATAQSKSSKHGGGGASQMEV